MSERELYAIFPLVFGGVLVLGVVLFAISLFLLQRRRTGGTYRRRRSAGERGGRLFIFSVILGVIGVVMIVGWLVIGLIYRNQLYPSIDRGEDDLFGVNLAPETLQALTAIALTPTITPTFTPTDTQPPTDMPTPTDTFTSLPTLTPLPTLTVAPTDMPTATPLPTATDTPIPLFTNTPIPTDAPRLLLPTRTRTTPPRN